MAKRFSGPQLRKARLAAGLSTEQLAVIVERSFFTINSYERDRARPSVDVLAALADALGGPVDDLFADDAVLTGAA